MPTDDVEESCGWLEDIRIPPRRVAVPAYCAVWPGKGCQRTRYRGGEAAIGGDGHGVIVADSGGGIVALGAGVSPGPEFEVW
jgi:hypothetical protein